MPRRKLVSDPQKLIASGQAFIRENAQTKAGYRAAMVLLYLNGTMIETICAATKETRNTISNWIKTADLKGFKALLPIKQEGRPCKLSEEQKEIVKAALQDDPSKHGYTVWQGSTLSDFIEKKFGIELKVRACQNLLKKLGFALIRPQPYPNSGKNNDVDREEFKKNCGSTI